MENSNTDGVNEFTPDYKAALVVATRVFADAPSADTFYLLNLMGGEVFGVALPLPDVDTGRTKIVPISDFREPDANDFQQIRAEFDRTLTAREQVEVTKALGYALRKYVGGNKNADGSKGELPLPRVNPNADSLEWTYDSSNRQRTAPDYPECFATAARIMREGSALRTTNQAGKDTKGTRLTEGIGDTFIVKITVR